MTEEDKIPDGFKLCECGQCNELIPIITARGTTARFKFGHNNKGRFRERNTNWHGGWYIDKDGYRMIRRPNHPRARQNDYVAEHILVMEAILGRYLEQGEIVHHINHDRQDNRPANLQLISSHSEHMRLHRLGQLKDMSERKCCDCGNANTWNRKWIRVTDGKFRCNKCGCKIRKMKYKSNRSNLPIHNTNLHEYMP